MWKGRSVRPCPSRGGPGLALWSGDSGDMCGRRGLAGAMRCCMEAPLSPSPRTATPRATRKGRRPGSAAGAAAPAARIER